MTPKKTRLHRSELAVPGSNVQMLEKAPSLGADIVMLDLEDAVAPDDKEQARRQRDRRAPRPRLVAPLGVGPDQRARHPLLLPRHRRRRRAGRRPDRRDRDPEGRAERATSIWSPPCSPRSSPRSGSSARSRSRS